jgi:hypothetical protein
MEALTIKELNEIIERLTILEDKVTTLGIKKVATTKGAANKVAFDYYYEAEKDIVKKKQPDLNAAALRGFIKKQYGLLPPEAKNKWIRMELDANNDRIKAHVASLREVAPDEVKNEVEQQVKEKTSSAKPEGSQGDRKRQPEGGLGAIVGAPTASEPQAKPSASVRRRTTAAK